MQKKKEKKEKKEEVQVDMVWLIFMELFPKKKNTIWIFQVCTTEP